MRRRIRNVRYRVHFNKEDSLTEVLHDQIVKASTQAPEEYQRMLKQVTDAQAQEAYENESSDVEVQISTIW